MTGQNRSSAVMAQRHEPHDSLDDFPTRPWATRALIEQLVQLGAVDGTETVLEPAANRGHMVRPLREFFPIVYASDVHDYGQGYEVRDFLFPDPTPLRPEWIITNPPFRLGREFALTALDRADEGVALFSRAGFLESGDRWRDLYSRRRPSWIFVFTERVTLFRGRLGRPNERGATQYVWIVWSRRHGEEARTIWIPPCRKRLERAEDYG